MSTTTAILELLKSRKDFIFTSNKEYWSLIEWDGTSFWYSSGDTTTNTEEVRVILTADQVIDRLREHYRSCMKNPLITDEEILKHFTNYLYR